MSELSAKEKLRQRFGNTKIGGKGTQKRVIKTKPKAVVKDDKKLRSLVKKFNAQAFPDINELAMITEDNKVMSFKNNELQASIQNQVVMVFGEPEVKDLKDCISEYKSHLGPKELERVKDLVGNDEAPELVETK